MTAHRPSLRWYLRYSRLIGATLLDRYAPSQLNVSRFFAVLTVVLAVNLVRTIDDVTAAHAPKQAIYQWVVQLIIMAVSAIISAALTPKPKPPEKVKAEAPIVEDGTGIPILFGTVWIDDPVVIAFKEVGTKKIKAKGGKKG